MSKNITFQNAKIFWCRNLLNTISGNDDNTYQHITRLLVHVSANLLII